MKVTKYKCENCGQVNSHIDSYNDKYCYDCIDISTGELKSTMPDNTREEEKLCPLGGRMGQCSHNECFHNAEVTPPQEEKVCEKNCPDYNGMELLHKEQCDCSCHTPPNKQPEANTLDTEWADAVEDIVRRIETLETDYSDGSYVSTSDAKKIGNDIQNLLSSRDTYWKERVEEARRSENEECALAVWNYWSTFPDRLENTERTQAFSEAINRIRSRTPINEDNLK